MKVKCLSIKQPYAYLIAAGYKTKEIRTWETNYRGDLVIVASKSPARRDIPIVIKGKTYTVGEIIDVLKENGLLTLGASVCKVKLMSIKEMEKSDAKGACTQWDDFFYCCYAWKFAKPTPLNATSVKGKLNIYSEDIKIREQKNLIKIF